jgi:hypothetical protein
MTRSSNARFMICINNEGTPASLEVGKVYRVLPTEEIARDMRMIRVIDESGEDYLYSADQFMSVRLPQAAKQALLRDR